MSTHLYALESGDNMYSPASDIYDFTFQDNKGGNTVVATYIKVDKIEQEVNTVLGLFPRSSVIVNCKDKGNGVYDCPIDEVACNVSTDKVICPHNGVLNPNRDMCQIKPTIKCPSGYTWDKKIDKCVSHNTCTDGGTLNETLDRCEKIVDNRCPTGYSYDSLRDVCWKKVVCAHGSFNPSRDRCELSFIKSCPTGYSYNSSRDRCERSPVCPAEMNYNTTYNVCLKNFIKSCPTGYSYNSSRNRCERSPVCPAGATYNSYLNKCTRSKTTTTKQQIFPGRTWTSTMGLDDQIWINFYWSSSKHKLFWIQSTNNWPSSNNVFYGFYWRNGYLYSASGTFHTWRGFNSREYGAPKKLVHWYWSGWNTFNYLNEVSIPAGINKIQVQVTATNTGTSNQYWSHTIYSSQQNRTLSYRAGYTAGDGLQYPRVTVKVFGETTVSACPSGYQTSSGTCTQNPSCPNGGQFDGNMDKCYASYSKSCPSGTSYSSSLDMCSKDASCPSGTLDTYRDKCFLSYSPICSYGNYDATNKICYSNPVCSLGNYNSTANECRATITRYCGANYYWDSTSKKCIDNPTCPKDSSFKYNSSINYSKILNVCWSKTQHDCPSSYTYSPLPIEKCENIPVCSQGIYDPKLNACYKGDKCPIDPSISCVGPQQNSYCSPHPCNQNYKCGYAVCNQGIPKPGYPLMSRSFFNIKPFSSASGTCYKQKCDLVKYKYISYCGKETCPKGFGVYAKNGKCYKKSCPVSTIEKNGQCYKIGCPGGYQIAGGNQCIKK